MQLCCSSSSPKESEAYGHKEADDSFGLLGARSRSADKEDDDSKTKDIERCNVLTVTVLISYLMWLVFMWGLPHWSYVFNDRMEMFNYRWLDNTSVPPSGPANYLCNTPPEEMVCSNGSNFADLPIVQWRMNISGRRNVGCGCGQGIIGEGSCGQDGSYMHTLSSYISTAPATGAYVGLVGPAIAIMWLVMSKFHHFTRPPKWLRVVQSLSLVFFQISFAGLAIGQDCTYIQLHHWMSAAFQVFLWLYNILYVVQACIYGRQKTNVIWIVLAGAAVSMGASFITRIWISFVIKHEWFGSAWIKEHSFFFWECTFLTGSFSVGPALLMLGEVEVKTPDE